MPEPVVNCGCGRTMQPEPRAGRGAYRCGCGARVQVTIPAQRAACVGLHKDGPCRLQVVTTEPLPLCDEHYASTGLQGLKRWHDAAPPEVTKEVNRLFNERIAEYLAIEFDSRQIVDPEELESRGVVYFIQSQQLVKIGTSLNVVKRMQEFSVPHITLLATEPGYKRRERQLHLQFRALRVGRREWFKLGEPLTTHINQIRAAHGLPAMQVDKVIETP